MKKTLLFVLAVLVGVTTIKAQTVVFEDDFESYANGYNLVDAGYAVWSGVATVTDVTVAGGDAYSGNNFAQCQPDGNDFYFRKNLTLVEGKTYTFEVMTKSPDGKNHRAVVKLGGRTVQGALVNSTTWNKSSITFTVGAGETNAIVWVYSYPISRVDVDDFKVVEGTATAISNVEEDAVQVSRSASGEFLVSGAEVIASVDVFTSGGQLVKQVTNPGASEVSFNLGGQPQGLFIVRIKDAKGNVSVKKVVNN